MRLMSSTSARCGVGGRLGDAPAAESDALSTAVPNAPSERSTRMRGGVRRQSDLDRFAGRGRGVCRGVRVVLGSWSPAVRSRWCAGGGSSSAQASPGEIGDGDLVLMAALTPRIRRTFGYLFAYSSSFGTQKDTYAAAWCGHLLLQRNVTGLALKSPHSSARRRSSGAPHFASCGCHARATSRAASACCARPHPL